MAARKAVSRKSAAKKAAKTRRGRTAAKKAATSRKKPAAANKAAAPRKGRTAAKKAAVVRNTKVAAANSAKAAELDSRIAIVRDNLRSLVEQAASVTGASSEELMSQRIAEQEAKLELLKKQREEL
jgi:hypothetical protein